ncbi:MAG TPA: hypothetical protein VG148_04625 [Pyrinomonadaceae bacterium]|nr:hypothetical protein [Pyrinomonadaceae bacterium]
MTHVTPKRFARKVFSLALALLALTPAAPLRMASAQIASVAASDEDLLPRPGRSTPLFRMEKTAVGSEGELLTVFGSLGGASPAAGADGEVPLVSILRDTLGDEDPENDRLRHVWMLTYTRPTAWQRVASAVPFLYGRVGGRKQASTKGMPPAVIDLAAPERDVWHRFMWLALQNVLINPYGVAAKSSSSALRANSARYRQAHILRALAILSLYEAETGEKSPFTQTEAEEIQARLMLADQTFGGLLDDAYLERVYQKQHSQWLDTRGHNWELLRQRAEAEGLYFEPLVLPDGEPTHALVWVAREDLGKNRGRKFEKRFLNIARPWGDRRLERWDGHTETRFYDAENRPVPEGTAGARRVELIPLALYGLDHPKIPSLLVDFRDGGNPRRREMSHRVIEDVARHVLALSRFGDLHYFLGRTVFDFVTSRRGMDINQPTRLRAYSQLKLLLSLDATLDRDLRAEIAKRIERVSLNPLENDLEAEARLARQQYEALLAYAARPDGLAARLDRDRRAEMVPLAHGRAERVLLRTASALSLGLYKHREGAPRSEVRAALGRERKLAYHGRFLRKVAKTTPLVEVVYNVEDVRRSLRFVAESGARAGASTARAAARIFSQTNDAETRRLCLESLYRINNETAKREMLAIYRRPDLDPELRAVTERYLRDALREEQRIAPADARAILAAVGR